MPAWFYFSRPTHLSFHDLRNPSNTMTLLPTYVKSLLVLGLKFCPIPQYTTKNTVVKSMLSRHIRDLHLKHHFHDNPPTGDFNPRLYIRSKWLPQPRERSKELERRFHCFELCYKRIMKCRQVRSNLLPFH
jgi:hypothetical protein